MSILDTLSGEAANTLLLPSSGFQPSGRVMVKAPVLCLYGVLESVKGAALVPVSVATPVATSVGTSVACGCSVGVVLGAALVDVGRAGAVVEVASGLWVGRGRGVAVASAPPNEQAIAASANRDAATQIEWVIFSCMFASDPPIRSSRPRWSSRVV